MASSASNFCSVIDDQVCINFDHNIKVHFKLDDSIMVKDYDRNSSISVAGTIIPGMTRLFSINRSCINVHHNNSDCLVIEMSDGYNQAFNNNFPQVVPFVRTDIISLSTDDKNLEFNQMLSCEDVFHQQLLQCDNDLKDSTRMLVDCSTYVRADNGLVTFRFLNGLEVYRFPAGHIRAHYSKFNCDIVMGPCGTSLISVDDTNIVSNETNFHVVKGITNITSINGLIRRFNST